MELALDDESAAAKRLQGLKVWAESAGIVALDLGAVISSAVISLDDAAWQRVVKQSLTLEDYLRAALTVEKSAREKIEEALGGIDIFALSARRGPRQKKDTDETGAPKTRRQRRSSKTDEVGQESANASAATPENAG